MALLALVAAACGGSEDSTTSAAPAESESAPLDLVLPTTDGGQLEFNDLEGKPALLWFWAPW